METFPVFGFDVYELQVSEYYSLKLAIFSSYKNIFIDRLEVR
jgi:hypothetical protein